MNSLAGDIPSIIRGQKGDRLRVFRVDVTVCPACGGRMKVVAALTEPLSIVRYLEGVGLPSRAPPIAPARPHPQPELDFAA